MQKDGGGDREGEVVEGEEHGAGEGGRVGGRHLMEGDLGRGAADTG